MHGVVLQRGGMTEERRRHGLSEEEIKAMPLNWKAGGKPVLSERRQRILGARVEGCNLGNAGSGRVWSAQVGISETQTHTRILDLSATGKLTVDGEYFKLNLRIPTARWKPAAGFTANLYRGTYDGC